MCLGIPSKVIEIDEVHRTGKIDYLGTKVKTNFALLDDVRVGDWVIVHAGFAISRLMRRTPGNPRLLREIAEKS